tara:strand:+ start:178 stop:846 length:669 start_codon:yes stop_codon:yes gene_type:complete
LKNKIQHIIWDWNGTLVDDAWLFVELMNEVLKKRNLREITVLDYKRAFCFPLEKYYERLGFDFKKEPYVVPSLEFIQLYNQNKYRPDLYPGIVSLIESLSLAGVKHYLLSAQNHDSLLDLIKYYQLGHLFERVQGTNNLHARGKGRLASSLLKSKRIASDRVLFIGDTNMDVEIALNNKASVVGLSFGHQSRERFVESKKLTLINSFKELSAYLHLKFLESL